MFGFFNRTKSYKDIDQQEMMEGLKNDKNAIIIDVRSKGEFSSGHIPKALNIDIMSFEFGNKIKQLSPDKTYYIYCRSGNRSASACKSMGKAGLKNLFNLRGGLGSYSGKLVK